MDVSDDEVYLQCTPPTLAKIADTAQADLLPKKSRSKYLIAYTNFMSFKRKHKTTATTENVLLAYFKEMSETRAPSSMWTYYSMLKSIIKLKENVDIHSFGKLKTFLKQQSTGFQPKTSDVLTNEQIRDFFMNAPDSQFLVDKVALILGLMGACRGQELRDLTTEDFQINDGQIIVTLQKTKNYETRGFMLTGKIMELVKKYQSLRPATVKDSAFFLQYRNQKCTSQVIGKHTIATIPRKIAMFLKLPNPIEYTGHCFRRSAATIFANAGGDFIDLKDLGGWKSDASTQRYIQKSIKHKTKICNVLQGAIDLNDNVQVQATITSNTMTSNTTNLEVDTTNRTLENNNTSGGVIHIHNYKK